jgi:hypothetical protein
LARENASLFNLVYKISGDLKHVKPKEKSQRKIHGHGEVSLENTPGRTDKILIDE